MRIFARGFKLQREALSSMVNEEWRIKVRACINICNTRRP
jgi:hypothetical protein